MGILIYGSGGGSGGGVDLSDDSVRGDYVLNPYTFHDSEGNPGTGLIYNWNRQVHNGASTDGNKVTVQPSASVRHIESGWYLDRDIELAAMPSGSATMAQSGNKVTLTKSAGYIAGGTEQLTLNAASEKLTSSGATVYLSRESAGYVAAGNNVLSKTIPLANSTFTLTTNGEHSLQVPNGTAGFASVTAVVSVAGTAPQLQTRAVTISSNGTMYFTATGNYDGLAQLAVTTSVYPSTAAGTVQNGSTFLNISCPSGKTLYMAGFMASSASYANTSKVMGGYVRLGSTTGRGSYITSDGNPAVGNLTASFSGNTVTITPLSGYSFSGMSYAAFVCYA